jgi:uncharacterized RDD family membrane protein YckC
MLTLFAPNGGGEMQDQSTAPPENERQTGAPSAESGPVSTKADLGKRFVAAIIDAVLGVVIGLIPAIGGLAAAAYWAVRDGLEFEFMHHRSVGKHLMKLRPVMLDGSPMDITASVKRNWMFALGGVVQLLLWIPFIGWLFVIPVALVAFAIGIVELFLVITDPEGRRLGDKIANTKVIEASS